MMILEGIVAGIVSNVISGILKEYITRRLFPRPLERKEIERAVEKYLAQYPGFGYTSGSLITLVNSQWSEVMDRLGPAISPELRVETSDRRTTGWVQRFAGRGGGISIYSSRYGTYPIWGEIGKCYEHLGGTASRLGFPTTLELPAAPSSRGTTGRVQRFEGNGDGANLWDEPNRVFIGVSIYSSRYGTYPTWGEIGKCYERLSGTASRLGFPISPELRAETADRRTTGWVQRFEGGWDSSKGWNDTHEVSIYASRHGAHPVWGEIAEHYKACGGTRSFLGFPTSAEEWLNGWIQHFEGGDLRQ